MNSQGSIANRLLRRHFLIANAATFFTFPFVPPSFASDNPSNSDWPGWRGPHRDGILKNAKLPDDLNNLANIWNKTLGDSYSGPIVTANSVFTTESKSGVERVYSFDRMDGQLKWQFEWAGKHTVPFFAAKNGSWIRSTPATDGRRIYVGGIRDLLVALDCDSGNKVWEVDFAKLAGKVPDFGMVCSPLIDGEHLYVQAGMAVNKLKTSDGTILWSSLKDNGDMMSSGAFSSPVIATLHDKRQLIVQTRTRLAGLDLESGGPLWTFDVAAFRGMNILTPTIWDNAIFTSSYGGRSLLLNVQSNNTTKTRWENKLEGYMSSPIVIDRYAYMHLRNKRFACINLQSGKEEWITTPFGEYWSMVSDGTRILALDQLGTLRLIEHNPSQYTQIAERRICDEEAWAHIAVSGDQFAIRSQNKLSLFRWDR